MANDFIHPDMNITTATHAARLIDFVNGLRRTIEAAENLRGVMDHMTSGADYTTIETRFGLTPGQGAIVYGLIVGCRAAVRSASSLETIDRIG